MARKRRTGDDDAEFEQLNAMLNTEQLALDAMHFYEEGNRRLAAQFARLARKKASPDDSEILADMDELMGVPEL